MKKPKAISIVQTLLLPNVAGEPQPPREKKG